MVLLDVIYIYVCVCVCVCILYVPVFVCAYRYICMYVCMYVHLVDIRIYIFQGHKVDLIFIRMHLTQYINVF